MRKNVKVSMLVVFFLLANIVLTACEGGGGDNYTTPSQPTGSGTGEAPGTYQAPTYQDQGGATPTVEPQPVPEPGNLSHLIQGGVAMAVMLPYNGYPPSEDACREYWIHMMKRHLPGGEADIYQPEQVLGFLEAVSNGTAQLIQVGVRIGGGFVGLFSHAGQNWLLMIGDSLTPTSYIPRNSDLARGPISQSSKVLRQPIGRKVVSAFASTASCFKNAVPQEVTQMLQVEATASANQYALVPQGVVMDPKQNPVPEDLSTYPRISPENLVGSGQLPIPLQGTPQWDQLDSTMWNPEIQAFVWVPNYGYHGLTAEDIAAAIVLTGGVIVVVGTVVVLVNSAPVWVPVIVIGGGSAAPMLAMP